MEQLPQNILKPESIELEGKKTEKIVIKDGVDFVFEQHPELAEIGTKEQYSQYLTGIFPKSQIKEIVYHGTLGRFDSFEEKSHFGTMEAVKQRLESASGGIEKIKKEIGLIIAVLLDIRNPEHSPFDYDNNWDRFISNLPAGSDGFTYINLFEDYGSTSYVALRPEQIHILGTELDKEGFKEYLTKI